MVDSFNNIYSFYSIYNIYSIYSIYNLYSIYSIYSTPRTPLYDSTLTVGAQFFFGKADFLFSSIPLDITKLKQTPILLMGWNRCLL